MNIKATTSIMLIGEVSIIEKTNFPFLANEIVVRYGCVWKQNEKVFWIEFNTLKNQG